MKSAKIGIALFGVVLLVAGCLGPDPEPERETRPAVADRIAVCSGGVSQNYSGDISVDAGRILEGRGELNAEVRDELKGMFLSRTDLDNATALAVFERYLDCIEKERIFESTRAEREGDFGLTQLQCRTYALCESNVMSGLRACREIAEEEGGSKNGVAAIYNRQCRPLIARLGPCWEAGDTNELNRRRAVCEARHGIVASEL